MTESRLVIGAGGTGRTHLLAGWAAETGSNPDRLTGSPLAALEVDEVGSLVESGSELIVADDVQWFSVDALRALVDASKSITVFASRRPATGGEADGDLLDLLVEILTRTRPADRLDLLGIDRFAPTLAALRDRAAELDGTSPTGGVLATDEVERLFDATAGSVGFAADAVVTGWNGDPEHVPAGLVDAVTARIRRAGREAARLAAQWTITDQTGAATSLGLALRALPSEIEPDRAERAVRAGGLLTEDGSLIPLVARAASADLTEAERANLHDRAAEVLAADDELAAARHLLEGSGEVAGAARILASAAMTLAVDDPANAPRFIDRAEQLGLSSVDGSILRALGAFHAGSPDALAHLEAAQGGPDGVSDDRSAVLGYGIDSRELRFDSAAGRPVAGDLAEPLRALAEGMAGRPTSLDDDRITTPLSKVIGTLATAVAQLAEGSITAAVGAFSTAADDFDRLRPTAPFGMTPHAVGALGALLVGDLAVVDILTTQAIEQRSGGSGEVLTHHLVRAYGRLVGGDFTEALELLRSHAGDPTAAADSEKAGDAPADDLHHVTGEVAAITSAGGGDGLLSQRDRLLLASLEAAIARRSGDTTRLRAAWRRAEEALIRPSSSWLLADPFAELLAAGARLGDTRRIGPIVEQLSTLGLELPAGGPGPTSALWLKLQIAIAAEDGLGVGEVAEALEACQPSDARSKARVAAAGIWSAIMGSQPGSIEEAGAADQLTEDRVVAVAEALTEVGDGWEASRILGQAALDEADPKAARRMLELARISASEHVDESTGEGLSALGLSERESEVALLVVEGRTHKEVGAQLFISPKTVEHHVAKIRQKVGASSRAELLSIIREAVGGA